MLIQSSKIKKYLVEFGSLEKLNVLKGIIKGMHVIHLLVNIFKSIALTSFAFHDSLIRLLILQCMHIKCIIILMYYPDCAAFI